MYERTQGKLSLLPRHAAFDTAPPASVQQWVMKKALMERVKLLRSTSVAIALMGFFATLILWITTGPLQLEMSASRWIILLAISTGLLICSFVLALIIYCCANVVEEQSRKLREEA